MANNINYNIEQIKDFINSLDKEKLNKDDRIFLGSYEGDNLNHLVFKENNIQPIIRGSRGVLDFHFTKNAYVKATIEYNNKDEEWCLNIKTEMSSITRSTLDRGFLPDAKTEQKTSIPLSQLKEKDFYRIPIVYDDISKGNIKDRLNEIANEHGLTLDKERDYNERDNNDRTH